MLHRPGFNTLFRAKGTIVIDGKAFGGTTARNMLLDTDIVHVFDKPGNDTFILPFATEVRYAVIAGGGAQPGRYIEGITPLAAGHYAIEVGGIKRQSRFDRVLAEPNAASVQQSKWPTDGQGSAILGIDTAFAPGTTAFFATTTNYGGTMTSGAVIVRYSVLDLLQTLSEHPSTDVREAARSLLEKPARLYTTNIRIEHDELAEHMRAKENQRGKAMRLGLAEVSMYCKSELDALARRRSTLGHVLAGDAGWRPFTPGESARFASDRLKRVETMQMTVRSLNVPPAVSDELDGMLERDARTAMAAMRRHVTDQQRGWNATKGVTFSDGECVVDGANGEVYLWRRDALRHVPFDVWATSRRTYTLFPTGELDHVSKASSIPDRVETVAPTTTPAPTESRESFRLVHIGTGRAIRLGRHAPEAITAESDANDPRQRFVLERGYLRAAKARRYLSPTSDCGVTVTMDPHEVFTIERHGDTVLLGMPCGTYLSIDRSSGRLIGDAAIEFAQWRILS